MLDLVGFLTVQRCQGSMRPALIVELAFHSARPQQLSGAQPGSPSGHHRRLRR